ncbi:MAG: hypothetical protein D6679_13495 [Candidatus Hydrogenedentota bacterium]|nr:MAG: hypothetical protein D6679_13495 [Candidatus Hydrogenedentota bacterium]
MIFAFLFLFAASPIAFYEWGAGGAAVIYGLSWIPFLIGLAVGGQAVWDAYRRRRGALYQLLKNVVRRGRRGRNEE